MPADIEAQPLLPAGGGAAAPAAPAAVPTAAPWARACTWVVDSARRLKREVVALYIASSDSRMPVLAKILAVVVLGYALSPLDLIPDFIPVLGLLDDLVLVPLGLWITIRMIPPEVMADAREAAAAAERDPSMRLPKNWWAAAAIVLVWAALAYWLVVLFTHRRPEQPHAARLASAFT